MRKGIAIGLLAFVPACLGLEEDDTGPQVKSIREGLSAEQRLDRVTAIRDVTGGLGMLNAPLLAGIAESETNMAHCWSEATWACQGPGSPSCGGGPVIAGSADGPCSDQQGGLGMFQFDAGTYADTIARDGEDVLLLEGNIAQGLEFVAQRVVEEIGGVNDFPSALTWLNSIPMQAGTPLMETWASMIVCRYNGCCSDASVCVERRAHYRDNAINIYNEYGPDFWAAQQACEPVPVRGRIIDERDPCYLAGGDPQYWRHEATGYDGDSEWTMTTDLEKEANYAIWRLDVESAGTYRVEVHLDGGVNGQSHAARYVVRHAGQDTEVVIDQAAAGDDFVSLGDFDFAAGGDQHVMLGDNTGEGEATETRLLYDALRIGPPGEAPGGDDDGDDGESGDDLDSGLSGGCTAGGGGSSGAGLLLLLAAFALRRRR